MTGVTAPPAPPAAGSPFKSGPVRTITMVVAGVVAAGALGGLAAALFGGDDPGQLSTPSGSNPFPPTSLGQSLSNHTNSSLSNHLHTSLGGGILDPSPIGSASPEPGGTSSPSPQPTDQPTEQPTTQPTASAGDTVTIGSGVVIPVLDGWSVVGQGDSDVLLGDGANSYVYAVTGTVDPSAEAASVISASLDDILPQQTYTQLRETDIAPLEAFGSVVSIAAMQYQATWTDQQASVKLQGLLICAVRQDGTAIILTAEHAPPKEFNDSSSSWAPVLNEILNLFGGS